MEITDKEEKPQKMTRGELLAKARQAKAEKARIRKEIKDLEIEETIKSSIDESKKKQEEPELIEEVVRIPANRKKKIVKKIIEIEESETDEEIVEEIKIIPKNIKKEVKISRDEMKLKLIEQNKKRIMNELF